MDKLFRSNWFVKIISFLLALMLYTVVSSNQQPQATKTSLLTNGQQSITVTQNLQINVDTNKYIVTGAPNTVNVQLKGPSDLILKARLLQSRSAFIDLSGKGAGTYTAKVQTKGFPSGLDVKVNPAKVTVTVQKEITATENVDIDTINKNSVPADYTVGSPQVTPTQVQATGGKDTVDSIAFVKGVVDVKGATSDVQQRVKLNAYDKDGNQLNVNLDPAYANVTVPVAKTAKKVPVNVTLSGSTPSGYKVDSIVVSPENVTIFGNNKSVDSINSIDGITVPVDGLKKDKTFTEDVPVPSGATRVEPKTVEVTVKIVASKSAGQTKTSKTSDSSSTTAGTTSSDTMENRLFKDVPIQINGTDSNNEQVAFLSPQNQALDVKLQGKKSEIENTNASDVLASVDVGGLSDGKHSVPIHLTFPGSLTNETKDLSAEIQVTHS